MRNWPRRLEYHFYDRNLLDLLSEKTGISEQGLESADEKLPQKILDHYVPTRVTDYNTSHYLFRMESKLIEELAEKECLCFYRKACRLDFKRPRRCAERIYYGTG